jgi:hypothetical protein
VCVCLKSLTRTRTDTPVLYFVLRADTAHWRQHGALLHYVDNRSDPDELDDDDVRAGDAAQYINKRSVNGDSSSVRAARTASPGSASDESAQIEFAQIEASALIVWLCDAARAHSWVKY